MILVTIWAEQEDEELLDEEPVDETDFEPELLLVGSGFVPGGKSARLGIGGISGHWRTVSDL